jgi:DNA-binding response OmpR family regulator
MKVLIVDANCSKCAFNMFLRRTDKAVYVPTSEEAIVALKKEDFDVAIFDGTLVSPNVLREWPAQCETLPPVYFLSDNEEEQRRATEAGAEGAGSKKNLLFVVTMFSAHRKEAGPGRS